jgi:site-specific recombinase XerD
MIRQLKMTSLSERTHEAYLRAARLLFSAYPNISPAHFTEDMLYDWFIAMKERNYAPGTLRILKGGTKFFFEHVIPRPEWTVFSKFKVGKPFAMRPCLTVNEAWRILNNITTVHNRVALTMIYLCGLRITECVNLQVGDIHSEKLKLHVHRGKGAKARFVPLPKAALHMLREYWKMHRHPTLLFPAVGRGAHGPTLDPKDEPMPVSTLQIVFKKCAQEQNINKRRLAVHSLRHSYATHLLELGVPIEHVRVFMGHTSLVTTAKYIHMTATGLEDTQKKIDLLAERLEGGQS